MLKPYNAEIKDIAVIFAHAGTREDTGNRVYSIAATILSLNNPSRTFESFVRYPYLTARDRYYSNVSKETLVNAPEAPAVFSQVKNFLKDADVVLTLPYQDSCEEIHNILPDKRIVDLGFAGEFFLPHVDLFSPKRLWEYLHKQERKRIYFAASEIVALSIDLMEDICGNCLNDGKLPRAAAIRHYLKKSKTLFGDLFLHCVKNYEKYFDALFNPRQNADTPDWQTFLELASVKPQKVNKTEPVREIPVENLESVYRGLSQSEKGFSFRASQVEYATHVAQALNDKAVLTIEAGTGTGKTQGYLIPVMEYLSRNPDERIAVSTYTKSLQDQIFQQEIAFIKNANKMYKDIPVSLLKGKSNYICAVKLGHVYDETWEGTKLLTWLYFVNLTFYYRDADGDQAGPRITHYLQAGPFFYQMQREVSARSGCDSKHTACPAQIVNAEAFSARFIVTNHNKLMLLNHDQLLAGLFKIYVIDEANHFEQAAGSALGQEFNSRDALGCLDYMETALDKPLGRAANNIEKDIKESLAAISDLKKEIIRIGEILKSIRAQRKQSGGHQELPANHALFKEGVALKQLESLRTEINKMAKHFKWLKDAAICRMLKIQERTRERIKRNLGDLLDQGAFLKEMTDACIRQNQIITYDVFSRHWSLLSRPVDVSSMIRENLYRDTEGLVYTSATICMDGNNETFKQIVGMDRPFFLNKEKTVEREFRHFFLGSPFSPDRMEMTVPPDATSGDYKNKSAWMDSIVKIIPDLIKKNQGRTLVLFSSYSDLETVAKRIGNKVVEAGYPLLIQRNGHPTGDLCDEFRAVKESVLFGVDTFWYGVDFKGDTLTQVIITRIPFPHPGDAMNMARKKIMHPAKYMDRYLYDTFIKMKQGIGRLIRCETDHGKVVVLDSRFHRLKGKFIKQYENKAVAFHKAEDRKDQIQTAIGEQVNDSQTELYIYRCGTCGEEFRADASICPACKQTYKQDRMPSHRKDEVECIENHKTAGIINQEKVPVTIQQFIFKMCNIDAKLQESGRVLHRAYRTWHYNNCNDEKPLPRKAFWFFLENHENITKVSDNPRIFAGIRLKDNTYDCTQNHLAQAVQRKCSVPIEHDSDTDFEMNDHGYFVQHDKNRDAFKLSCDQSGCDLEKVRYFISKIPIKRPLNIITDRRLFKIRQRYSRAYEPWNDEEDKALLGLLKKNQSAAVLSDIFQRQPNAIISRIQKLRGNY